MGPPFLIISGEKKEGKGKGGTKHVLRSFLRPPKKRKEGGRMVPRAVFTSFITKGKKEKKRMKLTCLLAGILRRRRKEGGGKRGKGSKKNREADHLTTSRMGAFLGGEKRGKGEKRGGGK